MATDVSALVELVDGLVDGIGPTERKRRFGCDSWSVGGSVFAIVLPAGRVVLRLPEPALFADLIALPGGEPWQMGGRTMSAWAVAPQAMNDESALLTTWLRRAHDSVARMEAAGAVKPKRTMSRRAAPAVRSQLPA